MRGLVSGLNEPHNSSLSQVSLRNPEPLGYIPVKCYCLKISFDSIFSVSLVL